MHPDCPLYPVAVETATTTIKSALADLISQGGI
jgi:hypothetical protein